MKEKLPSDWGVYRIKNQCPNCFSENVQVEVTEGIVIKCNKCGYGLKPTFSKLKYEKE